MKIDIRQEGIVTILAPRGKITIGAGDVALREAVRDQLDLGIRNLVLNLSEVTTIDSSGVGEMVSAYTTVTNAGGKLRLASLPQKVIDILQMTQLIAVFETFETERDAIDSFS